MNRASDATLEATRLQEIANMKQQLCSSPGMSGGSIEQLGDPQGLA